MGWKKLLLGILLLAFALGIQTVSPAYACGSAVKLTGDCVGAAEASLTENQVQLSTKVDTSTGGTGRTPSGQSGPGKGSSAEPGVAPPPEDFKWKGLGGNQAYFIDKTTLTPGAAAAPVCTTCTAPVISSVSDLVGFSPHRPWQEMEPNGLAIVGLAANFVATASVHVVSGALLGESADVRFTPEAFHWDFGDGGSRISAAGGASWADLSLPEFSDTATSHIYEVRGDYVALLTVDYAAEFRVGGGGWQPVSGTLPASANPLNVTVRHVKSVLVAHDCIQNPAGVGCAPS